MGDNNKEGDKKTLADLYSELSATRDCINVLDDVKAKLTKNKVMGAELPR